MQKKVEIVKVTKELNKLAPYLVPIPDSIPLSKTQQKKLKKQAKKAEKEGIKPKEEKQIEFSPGKLVPIGCDLANIEELQNLASKAGIDLEKPTLILSECVLTYMDPETSSNVISWSSTFKNSVFVMYEQTFPTDGFGEVMTKHFKKIGSPLRNINQFPSTLDYYNRFLSLGWSNVNIYDMNELYYNALDENERNRINKIEPFDEFEEWHLKCSHYFIVIAQNSSTLNFMNYLKSIKNYFPNYLEKQEQNHLHLSEIKDDKLNSLFTYVEYPEIDLREKISNIQRWAHASAKSHSKIAIFGGFGGNKHSRLNDVIIFDLHSFSIDVTPIIGVAPSARIFHSLTFWEDEKFILFGGRTSISKSLNDVYILNLNTKTWEQILFKNEENSQPNPRWRHSSLISNNKLFILGGRNQNEVFNCNPWFLDLNSKDWNEIKCSDSPSPRHSHSFIEISENLFLLYGGIDKDDIPLGDIWLFHFFDDFAKCFWEKIEIIGPVIYRYAHSTISINKDQILLIGGVSKQLTSKYDNFLVFDLISKSWKRFSEKACPSLRKCTMLNKHSVHLHNDQLILVGGGGNCFSFGSHFNPFISLYSSNPIQPIKDDKTDKNLKESTTLKQPYVTATQNNPLQEQITIFEQMDKDKFLHWCENVRKPFIVRNNSFGSSLDKWKDPNYLKEKCGEKLVSVHKCNERYFDFVKKNYSFIVQPFSELIENTLQQNDNDSTRYYLRSLGDNPRKDPSDIYQSFPEILGDFSLPEWFPYNFPMDPKYFSSVFRIGSKDMQLWTHYDMMDNILCHMYGTKHVTLWNPNLAHRMYLHGSTSEVIHIDTENVDKYPLFPYNQSISCTLQPGDLLYIPSLWFHNIHAENPCISINLFWKDLPDEFYEKKDLFGNKDLPVGCDATKLAEEISEKLQSVPSYYRDFYARLAISSIVKHLNSPL